MAKLGGDPGAHQSADPGGARDRPLRAWWITTARRTLSTSTPCSSSSATASATRSCAGASPRSTTSPSCRRIPASCTRSISSTWRASCSPTTTGLAYPDTVVGTDSHTTMINGVGVLGWGVGGIEAEAAMLGQPSTMLIPEVIGVKLVGPPRGGRDGDRPRADRDRNAAQARRRREIRRVLRRRPRAAAARRPRDDREHGARVRRHLRHLPDRRRDARLPAPDRPRRRRRSRWCASTRRSRACGARTAPPDAALHRRAAPRSRRRVQPSLAGPKRPQDRVALADMQKAYRDAFARDQDKWKSRGPGRVQDGDGRLRAQGRRGRDRRDHVLHQHLESGGDDRRRPAGAECPPARPDRCSPGSRPRSRPARRS